VAILYSIVCWSQAQKTQREKLFSLSEKEQSNEQGLEHVGCGCRFLVGLFSSRKNIFQAQIRWGFRGEKQKSLFMIWREYSCNSDVYFADLLFDTDAFVWKDMKSSWSRLSQCFKQWRPMTLNQQISLFRNIIPFNLERALEI